MFSFPISLLNAAAMTITPIFGRRRSLANDATVQRRRRHILRLLFEDWRARVKKISQRLCFEHKKRLHLNNELNWASLKFKKPNCLLFPFLRFFLILKKKSKKRAERSFKNSLAHKKRALKQRDALRLSLIRSVSFLRSFESFYLFPSREIPWSYIFWKLHFSKSAFKTEKRNHWACLQNKRRANHRDLRWTWTRALDDWNLYTQCGITNQKVYSTTQTRSS